MNSSIADRIEKDGVILGVPVGYSMWPMLRDRRDQIVVEKPTRPLKKGDVVLFLRADGQYVLHRIRRREGSKYIIRGDNCDYDERVSADSIVGVLRGFYRGDRYVDCGKSAGYRMYSALWDTTRLPRAAYRRVKGAAYGVYRRVFKKK